MSSQANQTYSGDGHYPPTPASLKMEAIGRLAGGVAHDFNNLLTVICGCTELLLEEPATPEVRHALLTDIADATRCATELTRQLLAFSRRQTFQIEAVDIAAHVVEMSGFLKRLAGEHIDFRIEPVQAPVYARLDCTQFSQVVLNLVTNARDAMRGGGRLRISISSMVLAQPLTREGVEIPVGDYVRMRVTDSGEGITPDVLRHIFEPFFSTKGGRGGTGMGLATVYGIVKQHGGFIFVTSELQQGTQFEILFPKIQPPLAVSKQQSVVTARSVGGTILVVEDEPAVNKLAESILAADGYKVLRAADGEHALRVLEDHARDVDVVLTDVVMPRMGGPELAEVASQRWPHLTFLFMSGYADDQFGASRTVPSGMELLSKPFSRQELLQKIRQLILVKTSACPADRPQVIT